MEMSQAKSFPWDISEPSFCVKPHKLAPQRIHVMKMLKLSKRTDSWKKNRAGISEVFWKTVIIFIFCYDILWY